MSYLRDEFAIVAKVASYAVDSELAVSSQVRFRLPHSGKRSPRSVGDLSDAPEIHFDPDKLELGEHLSWVAIAAKLASWAVSSHRL